MRSRAMDAKTGFTSYPTKFLPMSRATLPVVPLPEKGIEHQIIFVRVERHKAVREFLWEGAGMPPLLGWLNGQDVPDVVCDFVRVEVPRFDTTVFSFRIASPLRNISPRLGEEQHVLEDPVGEEASRIGVLDEAARPPCPSRATAAR